MVKREVEVECLAACVTQKKKKEEPTGADFMLKDSHRQFILLRIHCIVYGLISEVDSID